MEGQIKKAEPLLALPLSMRDQVLGGGWQLSNCRYANISQLFQGFKSTDMLEVSLLLDKNFKPQYLGVSKNKTGAEYKQ
jgi:hypothetical protein